MPRKKKIFVLDTNVILHDSSCLHQFEHHDIVIPITVMEELDQFKKGSQALNFHAPEFVRELDALSEDHIFNGGVKLGSTQGKVSIALERDFHPELNGNFSPSKPDHHILNVAHHLVGENKSHEVILVTKGEKLVISPLAYIRGRSLVKVFLPNWQQMSFKYTMG